MDWNSHRITSILERALTEDHALADTTTRVTVAPDQMAQAEIVARQECVIAGLGLVPRVFEMYASLALKAGQMARLPPVITTSQREIFDGVRVASGQTLAVLRGPAWPLLSCERVVLNLLQRLSGIATVTRRFVDAVRGQNVRILDTRKTAPGLRTLDKYAVTCGGGYNHRTDLSQAILIKNNHIRIAGGVAAAMDRARAHRHPDQAIEIEVRALEELEQALTAGADRILLDNMQPHMVRAAVERVRGTVPLEVSGGVTLDNVRAYAGCGVADISVGALTHSAPAVDLSMRIIPV